MNVRAFGFHVHIKESIARSDVSVCRSPHAAAVHELHAIHIPLEPHVRIAKDEYARIFPARGNLLKSGELSVFAETIRRLIKGPVNCQELDPVLAIDLAPARESPQVESILVGKLLGGPLYGEPLHPTRVRAWKAVIIPFRGQHSLVTGTPDHLRSRRLNKLYSLVWEGASSDKVARAKHHAAAKILYLLKHRLKGMDIGMDVGETRYSHDSPSPMVILPEMIRAVNRLSGNYLSIDHPQKTAPCQKARWNLISSECLLLSLPSPSTDGSNS